MSNCPRPPLHHVLTVAICAPVFYMGVLGLSDMLHHPRRWRPLLAPLAALEPLFPRRSPCDKMPC